MKPAYLAPEFQAKSVTTEKVHLEICDLVGQNQSHVTIFFYMELNIPEFRPHPVLQIGEN